MEEKLTQADLDCMRESAFQTLERILGENKQAHGGDEKHTVMFRETLSIPDLFILRMEHADGTHLDAQFKRIEGGRLAVTQYDGTNELGEKHWLYEAMLNLEGQIKMTCLCLNTLQYIAARYCSVQYTTNLHELRKQGYRAFDEAIPGAVEGIKAGNGGRMEIGGKAHDVTIACCSTAINVIRVIAESNLGNSTMLDCKFCIDFDDEVLILLTYYDFRSKRIFFRDDLEKDRLVLEEAMQTLFRVLASCTDNGFIPIPELIDFPNPDNMGGKFEMKNENNEKNKEEA
jgi:hypothetical protein